MDTYCKGQLMQRHERMFPSKKWPMAISYMSAITHMNAWGSGTVQLISWPPNPCHTEWLYQEQAIAVNLPHNMPIGVPAVTLMASLSQPVSKTYLKHRTAPHQQKNLRIEARRSVKYMFSRPSRIATVQNTALCWIFLLYCIWEPFPSKRLVHGPSYQIIGVLINSSQPAQVGKDWISKPCKVPQPCEPR